jgi:transcriptional regulator with XRE-family HTH domain
MDLAEFLELKMKETGLTAVEIERRSNYTISDSQISKILKRKVKRPSLAILQALALGAGFNEAEVLKYAGVIAKDKPNPWPARELLNTMLKIIGSKELTELVKLLVNKKPEELRRLLKNLK